MELLEEFVGQNYYHCADAIHQICQKMGCTDLPWHLEDGSNMIDIEDNRVIVWLDESGTVKKFQRR